MCHVITHTLDENDKNKWSIVSNRIIIPFNTSKIERDEIESKIHYLYTFTN